MVKHLLADLELLVGPIPPEIMRILRMVVDRGDEASSMVLGELEQITGTSTIAHSQLLD